ncbi:crossover junction endodeoxyribonuclease RuvC [Conchiformibius steedae]|uniref:Crossover junction endodeoxyribonuclease RuvC n=1 Tax=Conchiformibius steedae TaxID=153493 RepID=A0A3P2A594_9NEIS|nr:crossover junction endodeoxyribonuclease RuvC [Conchiformibius steedae]RRD90539.1 crossover junction endodeoxyribonuclease RuvC [Conchiformibius steedae]
MAKQTVRILGIDPGSRSTGFGVVDWHGREPVYVASGCITTIAGDELAGRVGIIVEHIGEIIETYRPNEAAVEKVFVNVNPAATLMLGQARGAAVAALVLRGLPVYEYTALQVKQSMVGKGKAAKEQVQHMVVQMLGLSGTPQADAADGLAVAISHGLRFHGLAGKMGGLALRGGRLRP